MIETVNIPDSFGDWDWDWGDRSPGEFMEKWRMARIEFVAMAAIHLLSNMCFLLPIVFTGKLTRSHVWTCSRLVN